MGIRGKSKSAKEVAAKNKAQIAKLQREYSAAGRDIGSIPKIENKKRRRKCEKSYLEFCKTYFKHLFTVDFSPSHLLVIKEIEEVAKKGGLQAIAMPRSSGKSTLCEIGSLWALLCGHRKFVMLIGATESASREQLENIKVELEFNELLQKDFPEALYPIAKLEGVSKRAPGQTANGGEKTNISWTANEVSFPTVKGSKISGATLRVAGITGRIRGTKKTIAGGVSIRPDLVLLDDIQTEDSAKSTMQCNERLKIINSAVLGLGGAKTKISVFSPCTVISKGDVADVILDRKQYPEWNGIRIKMMESEPVNKKLWEEYEDIAKDSLRELGNISRATEFYKKNQKAMDEGAKIYWEQRFNPDEISAIQHCMNLKIRDMRSFQSEYQNNPLTEEYGITDRQISKEDILAKLNGLGKGVVPLNCDRVSMYVDIQKEIFWYSIVASDENFTSAIIEYGAFPEQGLPIFDLTNLRKSLSDIYGGSVEGNVFRGLKDFIETKLQQEYIREDGASMKIERCLIDANWNESTESVYKFCRESMFSAILFPSHGRGITASACPMSRYKSKPGEKRNYDCILTMGGSKNRKHILIDTNSWKSFLQGRFLTPIGEKGSLTIYGTNKTNHELLIDHLTAEYFIVTSGQGRTLKEWRIRPDRQRNDWWDCIVGALVGLHLSGSKLPEWDNKAEKQRISLRSVTNRGNFANKANSSMDIHEKTNDAKNTTTTQSRRISLKELQNRR